MYITYVCDVPTRLQSFKRHLHYITRSDNLIVNLNNKYVFIRKFSTIYIIIIYSNYNIYNIRI